jgi:hypothetical protein
MRPKEETLVAEFHNFAPILTRRGGDGVGGSWEMEGDVL